MLYLVAAGVACVLLGWLWNLQFPVIRKIWTSSFVLVAAGYSSVLLGCLPLLWMSWKFGSGLCRSLSGSRHEPDYNLHDRQPCEYDQIARRFVGGDLNKLYLGRFGDLTVALVGMGLTLAICRFMYQRKIFLRV